MTLDSYKKLKAGWIPEGWTAEQAAEKIAAFEANAEALRATAESEG